MLGKRFYVDRRVGKDPTVLQVGLDLQRPVLEKLFRENPARILGIALP